MARAGHEQHVQIAGTDQPVEVGVHEVQPWCRAPVAEQSRLDMLIGQRFGQHRIGKQIDLTDRQIVGGSPPPVERRQVNSGGGGIADTVSHQGSLFEAVNGTT